MPLDDRANGRSKALGAFYTDAQVAEFLIRWAVRSPNETVMDPSFGEGVFLRAACRRIVSLGGNPGRQVFGIEIDPDVHRRISADLPDELRLRRSNLMQADFFDVDPDRLGKVDVVVGNPPFIRYQRFKGNSRKKALDKAESHGVSLSKLSSSWAAFLIHSIEMVNKGGRLAFVIPMEIAHAAYALPVIGHLRTSFKEVIFLTFQKKLFRDLNEDTLLILAQDKENGPAKFSMRDFHDLGTLINEEFDHRSRISGIRLIDAKSVACGKKRLIEYHLPVTMRNLYSYLKENSYTVPLRSIADVGIGYVTGNNKFFHLNPKNAMRWRIPRSCLRPALRRGRSLVGLRVTEDDWKAGLENDETGYLVHIGDNVPLAEGVKAYIRYGEENGVSTAYKCRTRNPWYCVPHVCEPDAFLTYMSGRSPKLAANHARATAPNTLHAVRMHPGTRITKDGLAALWQTSLVRLSCEIEGHSLGGGMLKLEPTEAENVLMPEVNGAEKTLENLALELDSLIRTGKDTQAHDLADNILLVDGLGLTRAECRLLREGADILRQRRYDRSSVA